LKEANIKKIVLLVIVVVVGYLAYTQFISKTASKDEQELKRMDAGFRSALTRYQAANRTLGVSGLDTTSEMEDAIGAVTKLKEELTAWKQKLTDKKLIVKADQLDARMETFLKNRS
jgi:hypothetical protein